MLKINRRKPFFQKVLDALEDGSREVSFNFEEVPKSYLEQPQNLGAKLLNRAGIAVRVNKKEKEQKLVIWY